ncbi:MAG: nuclear transport factor 2 family protein [Sphingomonadaceae bacterium]|nr:nuclear transport factor 2 family protein [Sphingomonadaceae bacterium]
MSFSTMRHWLAGGAMIVAVAGAAQAQEDPKAMFEGRYAELTTAMLGKDRTGVEKLLAAEYETTDIRGDTYTRAQALDRIGQMPGGADFKPQTSVLKVKLNGTSAAVDSQMVIKMQRPDESGEQMTIEVTILSADTWVQRGGVWLMQKSVQKEMSVARNGEVVFRQAN